MSRKPTRHRQKAKSNGLENPQDNVVNATPGRPSLSSVVLLLVLIGSIGIWGYVKWWGGIVGEHRKDAAELNPKPSDPAPKPTQATRPVWQRHCPDSVCAFSQEDLSESWLEIDDPGQDGWETEVFSDAATKQFSRLKRTITHGTLDAESVRFIVDDHASIGRLYPAQLDTTFEDATLRIRRARTAVSTVGADAGDPAERHGADGLVQSLAELFTPYRQFNDLRIKIKVFRITREEDFLKTLQTLEVFGQTSSGIKEITATWSARWTKDPSEPRLTQLHLVEFETAERNGRTLFSDCTESALAANSIFQRQVLHGFNHWLDRSQTRDYYDVLGTAGLAIGDVNSDGLDDLYFCQEEGLPNLMLIQQPNGRLVDASDVSETNWLESTRCALIIDVDNDGHNDLVAAVVGGVVCAKGNGKGQFQIAHVFETGQDMLSSLSAADFDLDGRLDVYLGVYSPDVMSSDTEGLPAATGNFVYYDSRAGGFNRLLRNECSTDQWRFSDVTSAVGLDKENYRMTLATVWEDLDNDGDQDLYVANDYGPNNLYRNDLLPDSSRQFVDIAFEAGAEDSASGMAVTVSDYDRDGWMDIYVSNMFSYAGNRIMFQEQFKTDADEKIKNVFRRFARGNTLLRNVGLSDTQPTLKFEDRSLEAAVNKGRWAWGSLFLDINNDSWDDLIVANGFITTEDTGDL